MLKPIVKQTLPATEASAAVKAEKAQEPKGLTSTGWLTSGLCATAAAAFELAAAAFQLAAAVPCTPDQHMQARAIKVRTILP